MTFTKKFSSLIFFSTLFCCIFFSSYYCSKDLKRQTGSSVLPLIRAVLFSFVSDLFSVGDFNCFTYILH